MREPRDEELILFFYGESRRPEAIRRHLDDSPAARQRYDELCRTLGAVDGLPVPERDAGYGERVWARLRGRLHERARPWWKSWRKSLGDAFAPPRLAVAAAVAGMVALAFLAGRYGNVPPAGDAAAALSAAGRERILTHVVAEHLERSERLLLELANAPDDDALDVGRERDAATALLGANRLYRQTSEHSGRADLTVVLDELERLLLDLGNGPEELSTEDLEVLRARINALLFKVRVLGWHLDRQRRTDPPRSGPQA